ncbi:acyltransferase family protein [Paenibacillus dendritiformis]|uniref:acyltransferase family protein n=1 Tax=Paenibacillus dendritiformis TaxID=130049 RepID=UPI00387E1011
MKKERVFYLDFIRALSMLSIVIFHFNASVGARSIGVTKVFFDSYPNGNLGRIGVSLFFILSGAALMLTYKKGLSIRNYLKRRFISIYPMFWIAYAIVFLYYFYKYFAINPFSPEVPKWTFALSIIGLDGYLVSLIPNYYILGEWFLGCIIIFYCLFPILRILLVKYPKSLAIAAIAIYFIVVQNYIFKIQIDYNILTRLPEFLFGMYFVQYFKRVNIYMFSGSLIVVVFMLIVEIPINYMYTISMFGISLFVVLAFVGQYIKNVRIHKPFLLISKYSFAIFLIHHVITEQLLVRFTERVITPIETYCLFIIVCIVIGIASFYLFKLTDVFKGFLGFNERRKKVIT